MSSEGPCPGLHKTWRQNYAGVCGGSLDKPLGSPCLRIGLRKEPRFILRDPGQLPTPSLSRGSDTEMGPQSSLE